MVQAKQGTDLNTSSLTQMVAYQISKDGFLEEHIKVIRKVYSERRDVMLAAMDRYFPPEVDWTHPLGGLFLWATLPEYLISKEVLKDALEEKVAFVPGDAFYPRGQSRENNMRLNFSYSKPDVINDGISRLGKVLKEKIKTGMPT